MDNNEFRRNAEKMLSGVSGMVEHLKSVQSEMIKKATPEEKEQMIKAISEAKLDEKTGSLLSEFDRLKTILNGKNAS